MTTIERLEQVHFHGILGGRNASGVTFWGGRALVVSDEVESRGNVVQVFERDGTGFSAVPNAFTALDEPGSPIADGDEMDLEGIAVDGETVFVLGSHSSKRKKVDPEKTRKKNRAILMSPPEAQPRRDVLLRFKLDANGKAGPIRRTSLRGFLKVTEPFASAAFAAGKENGVDAEGLAFWDQRLYVGFRGPVLRQNFTPILRCRFGKPIVEPEVLFVNLGGRGVRDLTRVDEGLLILAGPVGDGPGSYQLYLWDGSDGVPGSDVPGSTVDQGLRLIGELPIPPAGADAGTPKAEGLALIDETGQHWNILVVFDGLQEGHASRYRVAKP